jgi:hypothetical protein
MDGAPLVLNWRIQKKMGLSNNFLWSKSDFIKNQLTNLI